MIFTVEILGIGSVRSVIGYQIWLILVSTACYPRICVCGRWYNRKIFIWCNELLCLYFGDVLRYVGNAYLEAYADNKIVSTAVNKFELMGHIGHTMIISKALFILKTSGVRWHEKFSFLNYHWVREAQACVIVNFSTWTGRTTLQIPWLSFVQAVSGMNVWSRKFSRGRAVRRLLATWLLMEVLHFLYHH